MAWWGGGGGGFQSSWEEEQLLESLAWELLMDQKGGNQWDQQGGNQFQQGNQFVGNKGWGQGMGFQGKGAFKGNGKGQMKGWGGKGKSAAIKKGQQQRPKGVDSQGKDAKSLLNTGLQVITGRSMTKGDIVYTYEQGPAGGWSSTVTISCFESNVSFDGAPGQDKRQAELNASKVALDAYKSQINAAKPARSAVTAAKEAAHQAKIAERKASGTWEDRGEDLEKTMKQKKKDNKRKRNAENTAAGAGDMKSRLANGIGYVAGKPATRGDVTYEGVETAGGWIATVSINCMDGTPNFTSDAFHHRGEAEAHAAEKALESYQELIDAARAEMDANRRAKKASSGRMEKGTGGGNASQDPKNRLSAGMQIVTGRSMTAQDIVYLSDGSNESFTASVTLNCLDGTKFEGQGSSRKEAEVAAAAAALEANEASIEEKRPEFEARKQERIEARAIRIEELKAAKA